MEDKTAKGIVAVGGLAIVALIILLVIIFIPYFGAIRTVGAGQVGVVTRLGAVDRVEEPGLVIKIPFIEGLVIMETRTQKEEVKASSASKDLQDVGAVVAVNYHLNGIKAVNVYQDIGTQYKERIIIPAVQETFKATTAKFTASELIVKRAEVKKLAFEDLKVRLAKYNLIVDDLNIINFSFSNEFDAAIEAKVKAQQGLEQAKIEAETARTKAEGQANAQKILRENGNLSPEYLEFLAIDKWNGELPKATSGNPFIQIP